jgi:hypothetical protein
MNTFVSNVCLPCDLDRPMIGVVSEIAVVNSYQWNSPARSATAAATKTTVVSGDKSPHHSLTLRVGSEC